MFHINNKVINIQIMLLSVLNPKIQTVFTGTLRRQCCFTILVHLYFLCILLDYLTHGYWQVSRRRTQKQMQEEKLALSFTSLGSQRTLGRPPLKGTHSFKLVKLFPLQKMKKEIEFIHLRYLELQKMKPNLSF